MEALKIGLLGLGTVGSGTFKIIQQNKDEIRRRAGRSIQIVHAAAKHYPELAGLDSIKLDQDAFAVVNDPEVDVVVELIGGYSPAKELVLKAIEKGKHIVTANKALIALHGNEIFAAAQKKGVSVAFEAAVGGGIPIIKAVREGLAANHIQWIAGIINGTGNFILTEMKDKGRDFASVLKEAQSLGYAEADPSFDIEGIDAAHKLTILASLSFGIPLQFERCYTEGIANIDPQDVQYADELGYRIKHLGITKRTESGIELRVHPTLIPKSRLLANVHGVMNAVMVHGDAVGDTLYYGAGAGSLPTASAVVADIIDIARNLNNEPQNRVPHLAFQPDALSDLPILAMDQIASAYYLRLSAVDKPGVLAELTSIFGELNISIEAVKQQEPHPGETEVPLILLTHQVKEAQMNQAIERIKNMNTVHFISRIRVEYLN